SMKYQSKRNNRTSLGSSSTTNNEPHTPTRPRKRRRVSTNPETINLVSPETSNSQKNQQTNQQSDTSQRISPSSRISSTRRTTILLNDVPPPPPTPREISDEEDDIVNDVQLREDDDDDSILFDFDVSDEEQYNSTVESDHSDDDINDIVLLGEISPFQLGSLNQRHINSTINSENSQDRPFSRLRNIVLPRTSGPSNQQNSQDSDLDIARRLQREETMRFIQNRIMMRWGGLPIHDTIQN